MAHLDVFNNAGNFRLQVIQRHHDGSQQLTVEAQGKLGLIRQSPCVAVALESTRKRQDDESESERDWVGLDPASLTEMSHGLTQGCRLRRNLYTLTLVVEPASGPRGESVAINLSRSL